ncbi:MAG: hypothetical protein NZ874_05200 [Fimbriimonadales bacterium]|nr:hypothetical protein [Fimbriimonadales bacterium]
MARAVLPVHRRRGRQRYGSDTTAQATTAWHGQSCPCSVARAVLPVHRRRGRQRYGSDTTAQATTAWHGQSCPCIVGGDADATARTQLPKPRLPAWTPRRHGETSYTVFTAASSADPAAALAP